ncbi:hypothetical protein [Bacillus wiedmannii]|uniref:hypothetical protein n=1 Tax=Bacillus wiedmannii TaxID=1890302 RepID=UPI000BEF212E|nr:hypothetical protein [Bacillus wiedmannii]MBG9828516.1 hypothetical protein [Bacillus wiedmannii]PEO38307.1 hypothetical protein CN555_13955 [Bacillus wiedmannii]UOB95787.1 hypothetical protein BTI679_31310 [Bacillus wiedmannii]
MKFYNCTSCGDAENELRAVDSPEGILCEKCAVKYHCQPVMNENKVYGALNLMELLIDEHRHNKLNLKDLVRSLGKQMRKLEEEVK